MDKFLAGLITTICFVMSAHAGQTPEEFVTVYYAAQDTDPEKVLTLMDSGSLPPGDKAVKGFVKEAVKDTQTRFKQYGGLKSVDKIKTWTARKNPKYTGYSASLHFGNGKSFPQRGYLIQEGGQWKMTTAAHQD